MTMAQRAVRVGGPREVAQVARLEDARRPVEVIDERRKAGETAAADELLRMERAVRGAKGAVPLARDLA